MVSTREHGFNFRNFLICWAVSLGQLGFGYPSSIIGPVLGEPSFLQAMGLVDSSGIPSAKQNQLIGAINGVFQAGGFIGILMTSWILDRYGRKISSIYCALLGLLGGSILCGSRNVTMFIIGRFFAGAGAWGFLACIDRVAPIYTSELSPANLRGFFVGMNGVNVAVGYSLASYMGMAFFYAKEPALQWRGPLGIALVWPVLTLVILMFVPESPRWLLMKGRVDEARDVILKLHTSKDDPEQKFAQEEFHQMQAQSNLEKTLDSSGRALFQRRSYRKRLLIASGFGFIGQSTAVLVINNYGPTIYKSLGFDTKDQLALQCGSNTTAAVFNFLGAAVMDRFGRRPLILISLLGCAVALTIETAMVALYAEAGTNKAGLSAGVFALYLFPAVYAMGIDVAGYTFFSEVNCENLLPTLFPNHIRAKGVCVVIAVIALTDLIYLEVSATAFADIGWKYYLVFITVTILGTIVMYFTLPETKGIPLEDMAKIFGDTDEVILDGETIHDGKLSPLAANSSKSKETEVRGEE
ncbi:unnamed protein product [Clonostachys rosea f. rosea IK726]|uniref:Uncharacterized protein n=1 Tax=Clonostachys rosea f. rosea IK726 TaxID=1349383 RepID=A0ACA9UB55_BIOOC|nr:unnamed protein product [Clonostachys rosea f. rosea IK726]